MRTFTGRFAGKTALVTGAAQGIGREVALRLAREGASVAMVDRSELVEDVRRDAGGDAVAITADLEGFAGATEAVTRARAAFGRIDILVNNVGGTIWAKPFAEYEEAQIEAEIRRSLFPTLWCCRAVLPAMLAAGGGVIVNVSSVATRGVNRVPYSAAKGGVNAITASLAMEYAGHGIRVCATAPGGTDAPPRRVPRTAGVRVQRNAAPRSADEDRWMQQVVDQTKASSLMHRYGTIEEQAAAILFLASDEASYITGVTLPVAGGDLG
ncbi:1,6-dihydroxycyclohexa-2,4-diene-1-carboxylate dehydrogenase [Falsiroseomonas stagni]|uniref:Dihydroxycyclohexadiene carboxylate dehydrogenase n=1 Tax=Falsiroseomonas stagni DSM 19981 TaxID=1123062 RepID=A0A1I4F512_9PROT|nr:1,6-dihydroxycyclohexa-2,4-diene-1-carboxylate dehydrogenase [Falsiroseomonas stagni]SFL13048.1 dihydroxycyclohexadiene carboxylate dehydrogenase [Falsiroseomonas stagni DSM 19981]